MPDLYSGMQVRSKPTVIFKPSREKPRLFPYDAEKALKLFMKRNPLPQIYSSPSDVAEILKGLVGRDSLVIKHRSCEDLMKITRNDDG